MGLFNKKKKKEVDVEAVEINSKATSDVVEKKVTKKKNKKVIKKSANRIQHGKTPMVKPGEQIDLSRVLIRPRITEKGAIIAEELNVYTFDVDVCSTKTQIKAAIQQIYKVSPVKIHIAKIQDKKVRVRGQRKKTGVKSGGKKAFVYLKKGDSIEFV